MLNEAPSAFDRGLTEAEAAARLQRDGANALPDAERHSLLHIVLDCAREPMFQLLLAAGLIYLLLGDLGEALMLLAFVLITVSISVVQGQRSEQVLAALRELTSPCAVVIRAGIHKTIDGRGVVCGDLLVLSEGDRIAADARLLTASELHTDESLLTGESVPVRKRAGLLDTTVVRPGGDDLPVVFSGTMVVRGHGVAEVLATGTRSEIGRIGTALKSIEIGPTPLYMQIRRLVRAFATGAIVLAVVVVILYGSLRGAWLAGLLAGITLAMSLLPEEFPLILTVFMIMGAWRISLQRVLARRPAAIETLGAVSVLCTDKTGTLTINQMSLAALTGNGNGNGDGEGKGEDWLRTQGPLPASLHRLLEYGALASARHPVDPMEKAIVELADAQLVGLRQARADWVMVREYALTPQLLAMSHAWKSPESARLLVAAKGAPEAIAELCHMSTATLRLLQESIDRMATQGMRVLGVAAATSAPEQLPAAQSGFEFEFLGLLGLADPLRPGVLAAVQECRAAGIRVTMITGDYPATARAIAEQAGIDVTGAILTGDQIEQLSDRALGARIGDTCVFARVMPEQKLRLVDGLKERGEVVAMTGDGVNDAPALKSAHIGIAMGRRGTQVAREAAALVLLDDEFGAIVQAIRLGRRVYDNVQKAMGFVLAVHVPIAGLSLLPLLFGFPLFFTPVHIAFLELVIDPVCSIVFEAEPEEADIMKRHPRNQKLPLFSPAFMLWHAMQGAVVLLAVAALFLALMHWGSPESAARATAFLALVAANFCLVIVNRSNSALIATALRRSNRAFWWMLGLTGSVMALVLTVAPIRNLFRFAAIGPVEILLALGTSVVVLGCLVAVKALAVRHRSDRVAAAVD
ncbi:MAG: cation-translocating P-type ATPase [Pseudomonadota bacterium]|nr:cation-translocating P-type ATPase [Pseudomonadota bacterium]